MTIDQLPTLASLANEGFMPVNVNGADYKIGDGRFNFASVAIAANGTAEFDVENYTKGLIIVGGASASSKGIWVFNTTTSGAITTTAALNGTNVSISTGANLLSVTVSAAAVVGIIAFGGRVAVRT